MTSAFEIVRNFIFLCSLVRLVVVVVFVVAVFICCLCFCATL